MRFFGREWKWKSWANYPSSCLGCNCALCRIEQIRENPSNEVPNCFGLRGLFVAKRVHHCLSRCQVVVFFLRRGHSNVVTTQSSIKCQLDWEQKTHLMFFTLMNKTKMIDPTLAHSFRGVGFGKNPPRTAKLNAEPKTNKREDK